MAREHLPSVSIDSFLSYLAALDVVEEFNGLALTKKRLAQRQRLFLYARQQALNLLLGQVLSQRYLLEAIKRYAGHDQLSLPFVRSLSSQLYPVSECLARQTLAALGT
jgi:hypothetical protein